MKKNQVTSTALIKNQIKSQSVSRSDVMRALPPRDDEDSHLGDFIEDLPPKPIDTETSKRLEEATQKVLSSLTQREEGILNNKSHSTGIR